MHAGVRMPARAFTDERFVDLAGLLDLADADHARSKFERLVSVCAFTQHYTLSELRVKAVLGPHGVEALVRSGLATLVPTHQPTRYGAELELEPTLAGRDEWVVRLEYTEKHIEWYGQTLKGAHKAGEKHAGRAVDKAVKSLSTDSGAPPILSTGGVPQGSSQGNPQGTPQGEPSDARASEKDPRSSDLPDQKGRMPARGFGLRVIDGGGAEAEGAGS